MHNIMIMSSVLSYSVSGCDEWLVVRKCILR